MKKKMVGLLLTSIFLTQTSVASDLLCTTDDKVYFERTDPRTVGRLYQMLHAVDLEFKKHAIDYWLSDGALLGAVRHGGFIPWDGDVDIKIFSKDKERIRALRGVFQEYGFDLVDWEPDLRLYSYEPFGLIDIFSMHFDPQEGKVLYESLNARKEWPRSFWYPAELVDFTRIRFGPIDVNAVKNPDRFLTDYYGPDYLSVAYSEKYLNGRSVKAEIKDRSPARYTTEEGSTPFIKEEISPKKTKELYELMKAFDEELSKARIPYWITRNTLLAAVWKKEIGFTYPDVKVEIFLEDRDRVADLAHCFKALGFELKFWDDRLRLYSEDPFAIMEIYFSKYNQDKERFELTPERLMEEWTENWFFQDEVSELSRVRLGSLEVNAPKNPLRYLKASYGSLAMENRVFDTDR